MEKQMNEQWQYQLRVYLADELADVARSDRSNPVLRPLTDILDRHHATLVSQFDAFASYVAEAEAAGPENFPLYKWTKATVEDPARRAKHIKTFSMHVSGNEVYSKAEADALEADLQPLVGGRLVTRMSRHDTNPANNLKVPPEYRSYTNGH
jgi:hypothetical protein